MADHRAGFEQTIALNPYDADTRLVFADYLEEQGLDDEAAEQRRMAEPSWIEADKWLRAYAVEMNPYDVADPLKGTEWEDRSGRPRSPEVAFNRLIEGLRDKYLLAYGTNLHGLYELDDADELRRHANIWLGVEDNWNGFEFSCSC